MTLRELFELAAKVPEEQLDLPVVIEAMGQSFDVYEISVRAKVQRVVIEATEIAEPF